MRLVLSTILMAVIASSACACSPHGAEAKRKPVWLIVKKSGATVVSDRPVNPDDARGKR